MYKMAKNNFMAEKTSRKVKLHAKWRELQTSWPGGKNVPWLNVSGVWLEQAGFHVGDRVEITIVENQLIINPVSNGDKRD
jgi:toxic protein SymE